MNQHVEQTTGEDGHLLDSGASLGSTAGTGLLDTCSARGSAAGLQAEAIGSEALRMRAGEGLLASRSWKRRFLFLCAWWDEGGDVIGKYIQTGPEYAARSSLLSKNEPTHTFCHVTLCIRIYRHV